MIRFLSVKNGTVSDPGMTCEEGVHLHLLDWCAEETRNIVPVNRATEICMSWLC